MGAGKWRLGNAVLVAVVLLAALAMPGASQTPPVVKVKAIPVPWQVWRMAIGGVIDDVFFDPPGMPEDAVAIVRDYAVLHQGQNPIPLDDLTWEGTEDLDWQPIDDPLKPHMLELNAHAEYFIPTTEGDTAVLVRYTVAWWSTPDVIEAHFINEAILESASPQAIVGMLSNFDVHNDYPEPIDNFELELYGNITPDDVLYVYDPPGDPYPVAGPLGTTWYGGWGAPAQINAIPGGIELIWMDTTRPIPHCEWIHFGVRLRPPVEKVKFIPVPWQFWRMAANLSLLDLIIFDPPPRLGEKVVVNREWATIPQGDPTIPLEKLTWDSEEVRRLLWHPVPGDPVVMAPNDEVTFEFSPEETMGAAAGLVRYTVGWENMPGVLESRFINEALLGRADGVGEVGVAQVQPPAITGVLSNFDVHQDYPEPVDNFELELYGPWTPADILWTFPGWGAPPRVTPFVSPAGVTGIELMWVGPPVPTCNWVHFGVGVNPLTGQQATNAKAYWTQRLVLTGAKAYLTQTRRPDHYLSYMVKVTKQTPRFEREPVFLTDQFEAAGFAVKHVKELYNPVDKNGEGISYPAAHLVSYDLQRLGGQGEPPKPQGVRVKNQFGEIAVDIILADRLLVPSRKSLTTAADNAAALPVDHFKCYKVELSAGSTFPTGLQVKLTDQFGRDRLFDVQRPTRLCTPVEKVHDGVVTAIQDPQTHLMCYAVKPAKGERKFKGTGVWVVNQFGRLQLEVIQEQELCVPSLKFVPGAE